MAAGHQPEVSPLALSIYGGALFLVVFVYLVIRFCLEKHLPSLPLLRQETPPADSPPPANPTLEMVPAANRYSKRVLPVGGGETSCAVCLCEFGEGEEVRDLPHCGHFFHVPCIDTWLNVHSTCPICRTSSLSQTSSTPPPDPGASPEPEADPGR